MKIGLVPLSAKPYHIGHHALVTTAAAENDQVILFVSTSDRKRKGQLPILGADMARIWKSFLEGIMPSNVDIDYGGTPIGKVYELLEDAESIGNSHVYSVYSDPTDTVARFPEKNRLKYFPNLYNAGQVRFPGEERPEMFERGLGTPDMSGTRMREMLQARDAEGFMAGLPDELSEGQKFSIFHMLAPSDTVNERRVFSWP